MLPSNILLKIFVYLSEENNTMTKESLINKTIKTLSRLPNDKIKEVSDYADYILKKYDEEVLQKGIEKIVSHSKSFHFLNEEEDLYSIDDLKEKY
jgi:hypothetical protein